MVVGAGAMLAAAIVLVWRGRQLPASPTPSVAVIPFKTTGSGDAPWSGAGLGHEVESSLRKDTSLSVKDANLLPATQQTAAAAGRRLGVDYVVTGTVGLRDGKHEVVVQLTRVRGEAVAWQGTFWRAPQDVSSLADDLAAVLGDAIREDMKRRPGG